MKKFGLAHPYQQQTSHGKCVFPPPAEVHVSVHQECSLPSCSSSLSVAYVFFCSHELVDLAWHSRDLRKKIQVNHNRDEKDRKIFKKPAIWWVKHLCQTSVHFVTLSKQNRKAKGLQLVKLESDTRIQAWKWSFDGYSSVKLSTSPSASSMSTRAKSSWSWQKDAQRRFEGAEVCNAASWMQNAVQSITWKSLTFFAPTAILIKKLTESSILIAVDSHKGTVSWPETNGAYLLCLSLSLLPFFAQTSKLLPVTILYFVGRAQGVPAVSMSATSLWTYNPRALWLLVLILGTVFSFSAWKQHLVN